MRRWKVEKDEEKTEEEEVTQYDKMDNGLGV